MALTNSEEANILSAMLAKRLGCPKVMALISKPAYADLMETGAIDVAISPQTVTIGSLLAYVRRGQVEQVHSLRRGAAEAMEAVAPSRRGGPVVGRRVEEIPLPEGATIGAIVRGEDVIMAHHDTVVEPNDHVILFLTDRRHVAAVGRLFQHEARRDCGTRGPDPGHAICAAPVGVPDRQRACRRRHGVQHHHAGAAGARARAPRRRHARLRRERRLVLLRRARRVAGDAALRREMRIRDGIMLVVLAWTLLPAVGALPLVFDGRGMSFTDAFFEATSGLTTTGSTAISGLDGLAPSVNFWRHLMHWIGGMGIIVLTVAVLPLLGVGGMQLFKAETPGPMKDSKLTPRIASTAKALWLVYVGITAPCVLSLGSRAWGGSTRSVTPSRSWLLADSPLTTRASASSTPCRSRWC